MESSDSEESVVDKSHLPVSAKSKRQYFPQDKKVQILTRIRASNLVLFGPFTKTITPKRRQEEEQRLLAFCIQIGAPNITAIEHIYRHFNTWKRNIKEMIARRQKKTGIGKQRPIKEADEILYAIIKENPAIDDCKVSV